MVPKCAMASDVSMTATVTSSEQQRKSADTPVQDSVQPLAVGYSYMAIQKESMAERLARLRAIKGWSLAEAAKRFGTSRTAIWKWENGETTHIRPETLFLIAAAYGTDAAYILWGEDRAPGTDPPGPSPVDRSGRYRKI
jgi:DNA-binding XRE family transcriptional regulator